MQRCVLSYRDALRLQARASALALCLCVPGWLARHRSRGEAGERERERESRHLSLLLSPTLSYTPLSIPFTMGEKGSASDGYQATLKRLEQIQSHLQNKPRSGRLAGKVCIVTGAGSPNGIGCVNGGRGGGGVAVMERKC